MSHHGGLNPKALNKFSSQFAYLLPLAYSNSSVFQRGYGQKNGMAHELYPDSN